LRSIENFDETQKTDNSTPWCNDTVIPPDLNDQILVTASGRSFKIQVSHLDTTKNPPTGWLIGLFDFTLERLAEEQRENMLRFLSHDLRAPQSAILSLLKMQELSKSTLPAHELYRQIKYQVKRTLSLTDNFMQLDMVKSKPLAFEELLLASIVMNAADQVWPLAKYKNISIEQSFGDDEHCVVLGVSELLTRAIFNLLENSIKYSSAYTTISIYIHIQNGEVILEIHDEGRGISEKDLPNLFNEFHQFNIGDSRNEGYGLGLAFVKNTVQRHGASIECISKPNIGTIFKICFPLSVSAP